MDDVHGHEQRDDAIEDERITSPMQEFSTGQAVRGVVVFVVGLALTFGLPLLLV